MAKDPGESSNSGTPPSIQSCAVTGGPLCGEDGCVGGCCKGQEQSQGQPPRERGPNRRQSVVDRRLGMDRRQNSAEDGAYHGPNRRNDVDRRDDTGLERRRGPGRRLSDDRRSAEEGEMTAEQYEFIMAIDLYKKLNKRMYPTWTEVLEVMQQLGYRKVMHREIKLENVPEPSLIKVA
jgi:hypothetical protein